MKTVLPKGYFLKIKFLIDTTFFEKVKFTLFNDILIRVKKEEFYHFKTEVQIKKSEIKNYQSATLENYIF